MPISKVGAIVPDDDSDTEGFAPRDIIETDADIQRHAEMQLLSFLFTMLLLLIVCVILCWCRYGTMVQGATEKQRDPKVTKLSHFALGSDSVRARVLALEHTITRSIGSRSSKPKQR